MNFLTPIIFNLMKWFNGCQTIADVKSVYKTIPDIFNEMMNCNSVFEDGPCKFNLDQLKYGVGGGTSCRTLWNDSARTRYFS